MAASWMSTEAEQRLRRLRAASLSVHLHSGPTALLVQTGRHAAKPLPLAQAMDELSSDPEANASRLARARAVLARAQPAASALRQTRANAAATALATASSSSSPAPSPVTDEVTHVEFDPHTFATTVTVTATMHSSLQQIAAQTDPRQWMVIAPDSFKNSVRIKSNSDGLPLIAADGTYVEDSNSDPPGTPWSGYLFEEVEFSWDGIDLTTFRNLLNISFTLDVPRNIVDMRFSLYTSIDCVVGLRVQPGGLNIDTGYFTAKPSVSAPGAFDVTAVKRVRFRDVSPDDSPVLEPAGSGEFLNYMAPALVGMFMDQFLHGP